MKKIAFIISLITASVLFSANESFAQFVVKIRPVAPLVITARPAPPHREFIWIDGFWRWHPRRHQYIWMDGYWAKPRRGCVWIPGFWKDVPEGSIWIEGRWGRR